jgi:hypothetical protein
LRPSASEHLHANETCPPRSSCNNIGMEFVGLLAVPSTTTTGVHLSSLCRLLSDYRLLTTVDVGDGKTMAFWHDCWTMAGPLAEVFSTPFTHTRRSEACVCSIVSSPLQHAGTMGLSGIACVKER